MTMNGEPVQPEGLDLMRDLEQWLLEHPNDYQVQQRLHDLGRDPRFADADEPDDIMPEVPDLADFPLPSGLDKYVSAVRFISGASIPTSAACVAAAFNLLAAEDVDVKSLASDPHPVSLYFIVGSESGWRKSSSFRQAMQGHLESDERVEEQFRDISSNKQESTLSEDMFSQPRGFSPRALRQDFTIEALLTRLWKARRTMCVANSDASSLLGGWSFRSDNNSRTLSHFVNLWDGDPTSIDRRNPEAPEMFFYQRRLTGLIMGQVNVIEDLLFSQAAGNGFTARCLASVDRERPKPPDDGSGEQSAECVAVMRKLVIGRREDQDALVEALRGASRRPVLYPEPEARDLLAAASAKFDLLSDNADNPHERGFWARAQEQTARYAATLAYVRLLDGGLPESWEDVRYTRAEVDAAQAVVTWHGELIRSYAMQSASEKVTRLAKETILILRDRYDRLAKGDGSIAVRDAVGKLGKGELRTNAELREQVIKVLVDHRNLIPTERKGHYRILWPQV